MSNKNPPIIAHSSKSSYSSIELEGIINSFLECINPLPDSGGGHVTIIIWIVLSSLDILINIGISSKEEPIVRI